MNDPWEIAYVRRVLAATGLTASALAKQSKFASSTLTRALNDSEHKFRLSTTTLDRIRDATGIDYMSDKPGADTAAATEPMVAPVDLNTCAAFEKISELTGEHCKFGFSRGFLRHLTEVASQYLAMLTVHGDSMSPTLRHGDHVLIDTTKVNLSCDGMFAIRFDGSLHVKRVGRSASKGHVMVISDHSAYPALEMETRDVAVVGRVLWFGRAV